MLDHNFVREYAARMPHVMGNLIGQYRSLYDKPEPPVPVGHYYVYPNKEETTWFVCQLMKRGRGFAEEIFGTYATKEEAVEHLKTLVKAVTPGKPGEKVQAGTSATSGIRNVSKNEGEAK